MTRVGGALVVGCSTDFCSSVVLWFFVGAFFSFSQVDPLENLERNLNEIYVINGSEDR